MPKWEYLFVTCEYHNDDWRPRYANGKEVEEISRKWSEMTLYEFSNLIGERGWELVDFLTDHNRLGAIEQFRLVFKRPVL
jgi:hypothetical protein